MNRRLAHLAAAGHLLTADGDDPAGGGGDTESTTPKTFTQAEVDAMIRKRAERVAAEKYPDYAELQDKAKRLDQIEEANKTELQRQADRLAASEKSKAEAQREALRLRVATRHGVTEEDMDLFLTGDDEDTLTRQAERLATREADRQQAEADAEAERLRNGTHVPGEGHGVTKHTDTDAEALRTLGFGT